MSEVSSKSGEHSHLQADCTAKVKGPADAGPSFLDRHRHDCLEHRRERHAVWRNRRADVWRNALFVMPQKDPVLHHFMQMSDQHPLRRLWYASPQFASSQRPAELGSGEPRGGSPVGETREVGMEASILIASERLLICTCMNSFSSWGLRVIAFSNCIYAVAAVGWPCAAW